MNWIDAEEKHPQKSGEYIVSVRFFRNGNFKPEWNGEHYYTTHAEYDADAQEWTFLDWFNDEETLDALEPKKVYQDYESAEYRSEIEITGWMPMPEPYRKENKK